MFNKKPKRIEIEHQINIINGEAIHIKRTGSYILQIDRYLPNEELNKIIKMLKESTGAKWAIIQGGAKVVANV